MAAETIWDNIYKGYLAGGPAWASLNDELHPEFLSFMDRTIFPVKYALDIGCGSGKYLKYLQQQGFRVAGLDSSESAISMARELLNNQGELIMADMYEYSYPKNTFDLILSWASLHHGAKRNVLNLLNDIHQALLPNGKFFISLPCNDCKKNWAMMAEHETLDDGTCIPLTGPEKGLPHSFFTSDEIDRIFSRYKGLKVVLDEQGRWIIAGENI
jgi:SAM-dependent methyltransferase